MNLKLENWSLEWIDLYYLRSRFRQVFIPNSLAIITAAFSPMTKAVLAVFAPTIIGVIDMSTLAQCHGRSTCYLEIGRTIDIQILVNDASIPTRLHRTRSPDINGILKKNYIG